MAQQGAIWSWLEGGRGGQGGGGWGAENQVTQGAQGSVVRALEAPGGPLPVQGHTTLNAQRRAY